MSLSLQLGLRLGLLFGGFTPASLFAAGEQGYWLDPSDFSTMFQDAAGTTPVTAVGQSVRLMLDKSKGLALGTSQIGAGAPSLAGTATAATYNTTTGVGSVTRVDLSNQSSVLFSGLVANALYFMSVTGSSGTALVRTGIFSGTQVLTVTAGNTVTGYVSADGSGRISITNTSSAGTAAFTVNTIRELPGNHFTQANVANAPILGVEPFGGRRNLLTFTEQFDNAAWTKSNSTVTANATTSPDGTVDADKLIPSAAATDGRVIQAFAGTIGATYTLSVYAKQGEFTNCRLYSDDGGSNSASVSYNLSTGAVSTAAAVTGTWTSVSTTVTSAGNGWFRLTLTWTATSAAPTRATFWCRDTGDGTSGIFLWGAQLEVGSTATAYQRVTTAFDVTQAGVPDCYYLAFDGSDDWLQSAATIDPGAVDKAQVFAGVRKLSDAARGVVLETGIGNQSGSIALQAPSANGAANYGPLVGGTSLVGLNPTTFTAPITNVVSFTADIPADSLVARVNGSQVAQSANDQGTGNYLTYTHYIGRRGGTSLPFNGRVYQMVMRYGANLTAGQITQTETFVNSKTGAY